MHIIVQAFPAIFPHENCFHETALRMADQNLVRYASEAAYEMEFESQEELYYAVKRAIEICRTRGFSEGQNFRRIFKSTPIGLVLDWKLSMLAYHIVRLNGTASNPRVAELQVRLVKAGITD